MQNEMSPQESLAIITNMIEKTRHTISDSSHYFLLWGYAVLIGCTTQFALISAGYEQHYYAWWITVPAVIAHIYFGVRDARREKVSTYISEANGYLWMGIGFCFMAVAFIFSKIGWQYCFPFYVLFYALGTFVSGNLIRFKPLIIGGAVSFGLAVAATFADYQVQILITALSILVSYIIPGHMLRNRYKSQNPDL